MKIVKQISIILILITLTVFISVSGLFDTKEVEGAWYSTGGTWTHRKLITVDKDKISGSADLTDFPMLFSVTDSDLRHTGNGGKVGKTDGTDILFTSADGTTKLSHEIEKYVPSTGELIAWVKVPTLYYNSDTPLYVYYGNSGASDQQNKTGVWHSDYASVYHLSESLSTASGNYKDSTTNANNATLIDADADSTASTKIAGSVKLNGDADNFVATHHSSMNIGSGSFTVSLFHKRTYAWGDAGTLVSKLNSYSSANVGFRISKNAGTLQFVYQRGGGDTRTLTTNTSYWADDDWIYTHAVYDAPASTMYIYRNSVEYVAPLTGVTPADISNIIDLHVGARWANNYTGYDNSDYDEVRLVKRAYTPGWIVTEYNNLISPSAFYGYGASEVGEENATNISVRNEDISYGWYTTGGTWTHRKLITVDKDKISGSADLTDFPMLFSVTDSDLRHTGNGGKVGKTDGTDILFTSSDGTTKLSHEIEKYVPSTGELIAWVKIPTLTHNANTPIYMYFGNSGASDQQNITGTWNTDYGAVFHLNEGDDTSADFYKDSTTNANNGTLVDADGDSTTATKIAEAFDFNGDADYITAADSASLNAQGGKTISVWMNPDSTANFFRLVTSGNGGNGSYMLARGNQVHEALFYYRISDTTYGRGALNTIGTGKWYHIVATFDGTNTAKIYVNGIREDDNSPAGFGLNNNARLEIGTRTAGGTANYFDGQMDEVRILNTERTASWIATEYNNQNSPNTFYGYGGLESINREAGSGGAPAKPVNVRGGVKFR